MKININFDDVFSIESLRRALHNAAKGRRYDDEVLEWELDWYDKLTALQQELYSGNYKIDRYHIFFIREPKKRMIMSIDFKHRIVQWALYQAIMPYLTDCYIEDTYGCIPGRGAKAAQERLRYWVDEPHVHNLGYIKGDISKYFYRVDHEILKKLYRRWIPDKRICAVIDAIIDCDCVAFGLPAGCKPEDVAPENRLFDKGMPIGNLMSQISANLYLNELDQYCKRTLRIHRYIRYMDDFIILSEDKEELQRWLKLIRKFLRDELKLDMNDKTCIRPVSQGISFIGYRIWPGYTTIRKTSSKHMKRYLRKVMERYADGTITADQARATYLCYKAILDQCDCKQLKEKILGGFTLTHGGKTNSEHV